MAAKKYIAINAASTNTEERDLRNDVGEFAYVDWGELDAPFDTHTLKIGSHSFIGADWTNVQHAPSVLPAGGHFQVFTADNSTIILYTVSVASSVKNSCFLTRSARLVITAGVAESWVYFAQGTTQKFGRIKVASEYDSGMATKMDHEVYDVDFINQYAFLDRGSLTQKINFNTVTKSGRYRIENVGGWVSKGSLNFPPTEISNGDMEVTKNNCSVFQKFYPDDANRTGYFFREKSATGGWSSWFTATEGNMMIGTDKVYVPTYYRRGIASGYAQVPVYSAAAADRKYTYTQGYGISIVDNVISWVGTVGLETDPIYTGSSWYSTVNNASNWNTAYSWGNYALRNLTVQGAAGRVSVLGGTQSLGADRTWSVDLAPVHTGLSGGSTTQVPRITVDAYGRTIALTPDSIAFPVTSVNGQTGAVSLTTTNIPEGTNLYWTNARGDARYSQLGHTHPYTEVTGITAGAGITYTGGVIASTITQYTNTMARGAISASGLLSYNSTTGVMSLASVPWASVTGAPDFSGFYVPLTRSLTVAGTTNNIVVTGGPQTLGTDRTWTVDLAPLHLTPLSGGSATQVAGITVDRNGRITGVNNINITYPVTSVNGQTGAVSLSTTNIAEGTNLYWTAARGDARYSQLGHTHPYTEVTGITAGTGITYTGGVIASTITQYTNTMARGAISASGLLSYNSTTGVMSLASVPWASVTGAPDFSGSYVPLTRSLTVAGTTNNIVVTGGPQTLGADRTWTVDLAPLHLTPLSGGSATQVAGITVDRNGRITGVNNINITYPVTSVNGQTGAVSLSTTNIAEGTNLYWTAARGDARYSQLGHTHPYTEVTGITAGTGITYTGGVIASTITQYTDPMARGAISASGLLSYNSTTGVMSLASVPWANVSGAPAFLTSYTETDPTVPSHVKNISSLDLIAWNAKISGGGTANYVAKFSSANVLTDSQIFDNGSGIGINTTTLNGYRMRLNGAVYVDGDNGTGIGIMMGPDKDIRFSGHGYISAGGGNLYFRSTPAFAYSMSLIGANVLMGTITVVGSKTLQVNGGIRSTGQMQFADYTSASSFSGTRAGLLGFDASGNILTVSNDTFAPLVHNHNSDYYTKSQVDGFLSGKSDNGHNHDDRYYTEGEINSFLSGKSDVGHTHPISDITGLQGALDNRPTWGDVYTRTQLNTSGAGGAVHWDNVSNKPATYAPSYHRTNWSDVDGAPSFLTSFTETDPKGYGSHFFSVSGSTVTLGVQRVDGSQGYANFNVPTSSPTSDYYNIERQAAAGMGNHNIIIKRYVNSAYYGFSLTQLSEEDPKGVSSVGLSKSGSNLTVSITMRDGSTVSSTIAI